MSYFRGFPLIDYKFGGLETKTKTQNLMVYVDLIDQVKDNASFYQFYHILEGDRPDHVSQILYGTPDYYWSFFLLNDKIRSSGWPMTYNELYTKAQKEYPNTVIVTQDDLSTSFLPGSTVIGSSSGATGTVIRRRLNYGQIFIKGDSTFRKDEQITTTENEEIKTATLIEVSSEFNALHHYEDSDGTYIDDVPYDPDFIGARVTFLDRMVNQNNDLKNIKVLKPAPMSQIYTEYRSLIKGI